MRCKFLRIHKSIRNRECWALSEKGVSLVEFAMVAPFLILVIFGAIEFTRLLKVTQHAISLSREMANVGFRSCGADVMELWPPTIPTAGQACFEAPGGRVESVERFGRLSIAGTTVIVSAYVLRSNPGVTPYYFQRQAMFPDDGDRFGTGGPTGNRTKFWLDSSDSVDVGDGTRAFRLTGEFANSASGQAALAEIESAAARNGVVYIGEAYVPHSAVTQLFSHFFGTLDTWYDVTYF